MLEAVAHTRSPHVLPQASADDPGAIPSGFTERRQGVYELYSRIAADAQDKLRKPFSFVRSFKRASRAVRMFIVAKRATREDAVNGTVVPVGGGASAMAILEA